VASMSPIAPSNNTLRGRAARREWTPLAADPRCWRLLGAGRMRTPRSTCAGWLSVVVVWPLVGGPGASGFDRRSPATAGSQMVCFVSKPNDTGVTGQPHSGNYGNGSLGTSLGRDGTVIFKPGGPGCVGRDGSLWMKWPWWRGLRGALVVEGRRLDATSLPLRAWIPNGGFGYRDIGFMPSALIFPEPGCWEVTGRAGEASLSFVTRVERIGAGPASPCRALFPAGADEMER